MSRTNPELAHRILCNTEDYITWQAISHSISPGLTCLGRNLIQSLLTGYPDIFRVILIDRKDAGTGEFAIYFRLFLLLQFALLQAVSSQSILSSKPNKTRSVLKDSADKEREITVTFHFLWQRPENAGGCII